MAKVKGKFITLTVSLMNKYPNAQKESENAIFTKTGRHWNELDPEGWYETALFDTVMNIYTKFSIAHDDALVVLGRLVYPTIKKTAGLPSNLVTPLDYILFEAQGFLANHTGTDVKPRKFIKKENGDVIVEAPAPGYNAKLYEGVYYGILDMCGAKNASVVHTKSTKKGDTTDEFHITWK